MERSEILAAMGELKLYGMKAAFDETIATAVKRQHEPQRVVGDLLTAEMVEKQARSIKYQITIAKRKRRSQATALSSRVAGYAQGRSSSSRLLGCPSTMRVMTSAR
jgi:hypothetical protein